MTPQVLSFLPLQAENNLSSWTHMPTETPVKNAREKNSARESTSTFSRRRTILKTNSSAFRRWWGKWWLWYNVAVFLWSLTTWRWTFSFKSWTLFPRKRQITQEMLFFRFGTCYRGKYSRRCLDWAWWKWCLRFWDATTWILWVNASIRHGWVKER